MSRFRVFRQADEASEPEPINTGNTISGSFGCQGCSEIVNEATYDAIEGIATWTCSQGHTSRIAGFFIC